MSGIRQERFGSFGREAALGGLPESRPSLAFYNPLQRTTSPAPALGEPCLSRFPNGSYTQHLSVEGGVCLPMIERQIPSRAIVTVIAQDEAVMRRTPVKWLINKVESPNLIPISIEVLKLLQVGQSPARPQGSTCCHSIIPGHRA
jgi:hypothetical protein